MFFVSVASKGLSYFVSLLFATLMGMFVSVASKEVKDAEFWGFEGWAARRLARARRRELGEEGGLELGPSRLRMNNHGRE
jgi:hypothetical protein